ncbi:MAG TPA: hypothetical protein VFU99_03915 [Gaiellaceae bacterium]|nr:hypothetical protein [Gaiellaceae bacterium]
MAETVEARTEWGRRLLVGGLLAAGLVVAILVASAAVPRWWAQRVGGRVDGSITQGIVVGVFYGFLFTLLALLVFVFVLRRARTVTAVVVGLAAVLILASPNLMTLGIVLGMGSGAHAGDRILDVEAPAFRGATLAGAIAAALLVSYLWYLLASRDRAREERDRAEGRLEEARQPADEQPPED